jgi:hypothetical protein
LCRRLARVPHLTNGTKCMRSAFFTGRSLSHSSATTAPRDTKDNSAKTINDSSDRTSDTSWGKNRSSKVVVNLEPASSFNLHGLRVRFRQLSERSAVAVRRRADDFTTKTVSTFSQLGLHLNRVTGYEEIEALKRQVVEQGASS